MILDCTPAAEVIVIPAPEPTLGEAALNLLVAPFEPLREQFTAITGFGLELDEDWHATPDAAPRRIVLPGTADSDRFSYLAAGRPGGQRVVFLHGSPGTAEEWAGFLTDVPDTLYFLAVDRPGFGESAEQAEINLDAQARAIAPLLDTPDDKGAVIVGYSYGGALALRLAADYPEQVAGLLLIAAAADPMREEIHPLQEVAATTFFEALLPQELANANTELLALKPQLEKLATVFDRIEAPVTVIQGLSDSLVPPENAFYILTMLTDNTPQRMILVEEADHFLPWTHLDLLKNALDCVLADVNGQFSDVSSGDR